MVSNRLRRRLRATGIADVLRVLRVPHLRRRARPRCPRFLDEITTNETYFYRDPHHFEWFGETFLPEVAERAGSGSGRGPSGSGRRPASTGEELYSIALKVLPPAGQLFGGWTITLLGTDLSGAALDAARAGSYDARAVRLVGQADRELAISTTTPAARRWTLKPEVRSLATWKPHNLLAADRRGAVRLHLHQERPDLFRRRLEADRGPAPARLPGPGGIPRRRAHGGDLQHARPARPGSRPGSTSAPA